MLRKLAAAAAASIVMAIGSIAWADPAQAAPGGACSTEEWRNPGNFVDCVKRTRQAVTDKTGCVTAPTPGTPTSGLAGMFASEPDSARRNGVQGQYSLYGVGGYGFDTYDIGCLGTVKHPNLVATNSFASGEMGIAAGIIGAANGLRERAYNPQSLWSWSDGFVQEATTTIYKYVFSVFGAITVICVGVFMLWSARLGNLPAAMRTAGWAVFVFVLATSVARWPVESVRVADTGATAVLNTVHSVLGPGPQSLPADQCVLGGDACIDNRTVATRSSDVVTEAILYRSWLRGVLGDADSEVARKYGPALFDATAMTWGEATRGNGASPQLRQQLIEQKAQTWNTIAAQIQAEDAVAYEHLQGVHSGDRAGAGFFAVAAAVLFSFFDMIASVVVLASYGLFRFAVIGLPLLATIGIAWHASAAVRRLLNAVVSALFNIGVFGAAAGIYLSVCSAVFRSTLPNFFQLLIIAFTALIGMLLSRPFRRIKSTALGKASQTPDNFLIRAIKKTAQASTDSTTSTDSKASPDEVVRPETGTQAPRRVTSRIASTVLADGDPAPRPETGGLADTARRVATVATAASTGGPVAGAATAVATAPRPENSTRS